MELSDTFKMSIHICRPTQYCICEDHNHTVFMCSCTDVCSRGCILNVNYLSLFLYTDISDKDSGTVTIRECHCVKCVIRPECVGAERL
jgi:hypothetical protein